MDVGYLRGATRQGGSWVVGGGVCYRGLLGEYSQCDEGIKVNRQVTRQIRTNYRCQGRRRRWVGGGGDSGGPDSLLHRQDQTLTHFHVTSTKPPPFSW
ncbi:hypothetical protein E2C01_043958 [Portunus trituberculatus]|uniref:Uncharacterized protein n=1 Tax=Portunus trituberculatus TaxID=210409 RepID=A0A5B7FX28_PORTR|nr:hypothetical protein [Portunus trituberculatus]